MKNLHTITNTPTEWHLAARMLLLSFPSMRFRTHGNQFQYQMDETSDWRNLPAHDLNWYIGSANNVIARREPLADDTGRWE